MAHSLKRSQGFKILLTFVYGISAAAATIGSIGSLHLYEKSYYSSNVEKLTHNLMNDICADDMYSLNTRFQRLKEEGYFDELTSKQLRDKLYEGFMDGYSMNDTNFFFTICDMDDNVLLSSYDHKDYQCTQVQVYTDTGYDHVELEMDEKEWNAFNFPAEALNADVWNEQLTEPDNTQVETEMPNLNIENIEFQHDEEGAFLVYYDANGNESIIRFDENGTPYAIERSDESVLEEIQYDNEEHYLYHVSYDMPVNNNSYYISGYVRSDLTVRDRYSNVRSIVVTRYNYRYAFPIAAIAGLFIALACLIFLVSTAGYGKEQKTPGATIFEKIPLDIFTAGIVTAAGGALLLLDHMTSDSYTELAAITGVTILWGLLALWWLMSVAMRMRTKQLLTNNLLFFVGKWIWTLCRNAAEYTKSFFSALPFIWQAGVAAVLFLVVNTIANVAMHHSVFVGLAVCFPLYGATLFYVLLITWNLHVLRKGGEQLADGKLSETIPEEKLFGFFKTHAQHLNSIGEGMNKAVSDRLKSEMFRTELISNVSHDIRTPLTSIINYTNLLSGLKLENEQAQEYITVLSRQSERLRKLTEDVLEASKATTGNVKVNKEVMDLRVLLEQIEGEFSERLEEKRLTLIKDVPEEPQYISVDGRLLWRVMDNLFNNICKYAMEGTRVYLNMLSVDGQVICMLRNISGAQLNISADALMERFVRGDRSRNTEGSGLGLSIAQSLTSLQGGTLELQIDGDLFKVTLHFPAAELQKGSDKE